LGASSHASGKQQEIYLRRLLMQLFKNSQVVYQNFQINSYHWFMKKEAQKNYWLFQAHDERK